MEVSMAKAQAPDVQSRATYSSLDRLERRLDDTMRRVQARRDLAPHRAEGEALHQRRARLRDQMQGGPDAASVEREIASLTDAVERWAKGVDQRYQSSPRPH
jgi:hypothetical protein